MEETPEADTIECPEVSSPIHARVRAARAKQTPKVNIDKAAALLVNPETGKPIKGSMYAYMERGVYPFKPWMLRILAKEWNEPDLASGILVTEPEPHEGLIPDFGSIPAGAYDLNSSDPAFTAVPLEYADPDRNVSVTVDGDSMFPTLQDGDKVIVRRNPAPPSGKIVVVRAGNEWAIKRYLFVDGKPTLVSDNPDHPAIDGRDCEFFGQVINLYYRKLG